MKLFQLLTCFVLLLAFSIAACSPEAAPTRPPATVPETRPASEDRWQTVLRAAKNEGKVVIYSGWGAQKRTLLTEAFQNKFGIDLEFVTFGRGSEMVARAKAERVAGLRIPDILGRGPDTLLSFKKEGLLGPPLEPLLMLPEVNDPAAWRGGQLPFMDSERRMIGMVAVVQRRIMYSTDLVKQGEITNYRDLLKPQYKGKIILNDPTISGAGVSLFADLARDIWNLEEASEFLRQLLKNDITIVRDTRFQIETVARGKYAIGLAPTSDVFGEFVGAGAPITYAVLKKEGALIAPGGGTMALALDPPHPDAAIVFLNWLLTKEGQTLFSVKGEGSPSFRLDVPTEGVLPIFLLQPDEKFWIDTEEINLFRTEMLEVTRAIIAKATQK